MASNSSSICQYKIMRQRPPAPIRPTLPRGIKASGRVEAQGEAEEVGGASKNWLLMKTIENSETTLRKRGRGRAACCLLFLESSRSQLADTPCPQPPPHSPSHRNWLNWLRLLISIKAFNRQAPQTAGNILFIWGFCLHNRQASRQRIISTTPLPLSCVPTPRVHAQLRAWPSGMWIKAWNIRAKLFALSFRSTLDSHLKLAWK